MFPCSTIGETTQRIAFAVLEATKRTDYRIDIHMASADFEELPQVRLHGPSDEERKTASLFGQWCHFLGESVCWRVFR